MISFLVHFLIFFIMTFLTLSLVFYMMSFIISRKIKFLYSCVVDIKKIDFIRLIFLDFIKKIPLSKRIPSYKGYKLFNIIKIKNLENKRLASLENKDYTQIPKLRKVIHKAFKSVLRTGGLDYKYLFTNFSSTAIFYRQSMENIGFSLNINSYSFHIYIIFLSIFFEKIEISNCFTWNIPLNRRCNEMEGEAIKNKYFIFNT